jgi:hypothetical protein
VVSGIIRILTVLATLITLFGLVLAACIKTDSVSSIILPLYPRYNLALEGIKVLQAKPQPLKQGDKPAKGSTEDKPIMATFLGIDHPSWAVMLDFIKSDIAFRKSDRNLPTKEPFVILDDNEKVTQTSKLPKINYDRIKTILVLRVRDVLQIGGTPVNAPYRMLIVDPTQVGKPRRVYDFLSFEELKLDLKKMFINELEFYSIVCAIIGFICNIVLFIIRKYYLKGNNLTAIAE